MHRRGERTGWSRSRAVLALPVVMLAACSGSQPAPPDPVPSAPAVSPSPTGEPAASVTVPGTELSWAAYLDGVIAVLETVHPDGGTVDWEARREELGVAEVDSASDGYRVASALARSLDDRATFFWDAIALQRMASEAATSPTPDESHLPSGGTLGGGVALLELPFTSQDGTERQRYRDAALAILGQEAGGCGWAIDLRRSGGDLHLLGQAVAPLLGEGPVLTADGRFPIDVSVAEGRWLVDGEPPGPVDLADFRLPDEAADVVVTYLGAADEPAAPVPAEALPEGPDGTAPVALLIDENTGVAAQLVAVAFRGRPGPLRLFGPRSPPDRSAFGSVFVLVDGSRLSVTTHVVSDRDGNDHAVRPDIETLTPLEDARGWLAEQPGCRG